MLWQLVWILGFSPRRDKMDFPAFGIRIFSGLIFDWYMFIWIFLLLDLVSEIHTGVLEILDFWMLTPSQWHVASGPATREAGHLTPPFQVDRKAPVISLSLDLLTPIFTNFNIYSACLLLADTFFKNKNLGLCVVMQLLNMKKNYLQTIDPIKEKFAVYSVYV